MLNPLSHPVCLSYPLRLVPAASAEYVPFSMFLVDILRPGTIVELGTLSGVSYCGFCQAVKELKLDTRCYAIDTWTGQGHIGFCGPEALEDLKTHHDPLYGNFSTLIQSTFDQAADKFADGSIDLLHLDAYHNYETAKHDFERWLPKLSSRGVILLNGVNARDEDSGVSELWSEVKTRYPHFELLHERGLGLAAVGELRPDSLGELLKLSGAETAAIGEIFYHLGERLRIDLPAGLATEAQIEQGSSINSVHAAGSVASLLATLTTQQRTIESLSSGLSKQDQTLQRRSDELEERDKIILARNEQVDWLKKELNESQTTIKRLNGSSHLLRAEFQKKDETIKLLSRELAQKEALLERIASTLGWRLLSLFGPIKYRYLLPLYRLLRLTPYQTSADPQVLTQDLAIMPTVLPPTMRIEDLDLAHGEESELNQPPDDQTSEQFDFYGSITILPRPREEEVDAILDKRPPDAPLHRADVVCFSIIDWEFRYQRPQQIMSQFAAHGHRVFYVSTSRFLPKGSAPRTRVSVIKNNVYEVQLACERPPDVYGEVIDGDNRSALLESLAELRRTFGIEDAIGYVMIASWGSVALEARQRWGWQVAYDCMDEWENFPGIKHALLELESQLVRKCDQLVVTGRRLYEKWQKHNRSIVLARNAVDIGFYAERYRPNTLLDGVSHPIIGYYGAIADWFDVELVAYAARQRPHYTFVLLGGVFDVDISALKDLPNVRVLGQQPYETMPKYLYHFDACMIPFKVNPITEATDPVKVYEYLSAGKPVVSIALPEIEPLNEYLYLAKQPQEFVLQLDKALTENDPELVARRRSFARDNTWTERYQRIEEALATATPSASIIVVTYNNLELNKLCLESIIRNTEYQNYEVIVVDNASSDGTPGYLRYMATQFANIKVILNPGNNGFARANNQGIAQSTGEYIVLLNNDTIVPPGWLSRLLRHLEHKEIGMVGPVTNFVGNEAKIDVPYQTWAELEAFAKWYTWEHDGQIADIHMLAMFCVGFRREVYDEIGPLDEQFGIGMFEDDDYAQRLKKKGYRVVCAADAFVHHFGQAAFKKLIDNGNYNPLFEENRRRYETKWNVKWIPHKHAQLNFKAQASTQST